MKIVTLAAATALVVGSLLAGTPAAARADASPTVEEARLALLDVVGTEGQLLMRAKRVKRLAVIDSAEAMRALVQGLQTFVVRWDRRQADADKIYETFKANGYDKFTSNTDPKFWDTKKRLTDQIERNDEVLRADSGLAQVFVASISNLKAPESIDQLLRAINEEGREKARSILYEGVLRNPYADGVAIAKKAVKDSDPGVRLRALEALAVREEPGLVLILIKALAEKGWPHRQAAIHGLKAIPDVRAVAPLINAMGQEEGRLIEDYAEALEACTGEKLGPYPESWKQWYDDHKDELVAKGAKKTTAKRPRKIERKQINYYGIKTLSKRLVFIIDISGSMHEVIGEKDAAPVTGGDEKLFHGPKIEIAKKTLKRAIRALHEETFFNIVVFNHGVRVFNEGMLKATQDGKNRAYLMINDLQPSGATYTYGALKETFLMAGRGVSDKAYNPGLDTIFLLSDGAPTNDDLEKTQNMDGKVITDAVKEWNQLKRVRIHTIAIDPRVGTGNFVKFMKQLARQNKGTYTEIPSKEDMRKRRKKDAEDGAGDGGGDE